jgi:hypothetical protein
VAGGRLNVRGERQRQGVAGREKMRYCVINTVAIFAGFLIPVTGIDEM